MKCEKTGKNIWISEQAARYAESKITEANGGEKHKIQIYECRHCGGWHYSRHWQSNVLVHFGTAKLNANCRLTIYFSPNHVHGRFWRRDNKTVIVNRVMHCPAGLETTGRKIRDMITRMLHDAGFPCKIQDTMNWYYERLGIPHAESVVNADPNQ